MGWSIGYDTTWKRDIGYGVPAICDHPGCIEKIDRGLYHVCCDEEPFGGDGCGLYFCDSHQGIDGKCNQCQNNLEPFPPKPDSDEWINHKLHDPSWSKWREENNSEVNNLRLSALVPSNLSDQGPASAGPLNRVVRRRGTYDCCP